MPFYPDTVMHRLVVNVLRPVIEPSFYQFSCGSIPNRGTHYAKVYVESAIQRHPILTKYCFQFDIRKYYDSVKREYMMKSLSCKIKDNRFLALIELLLPEKGLPIGYYLSQWLANFFLTPLDNIIRRAYCKKHGKCSRIAFFYCRYVDDGIILGNNKKQLAFVKRMMEMWLSKVELQLKHTWQIYPIDARPVNFVGFLMHRHATKMRKRNLIKLTRSAHEYKTKPESFVSRYASVKHSSSRFLETHYKPIFDKARKIISKNAKEKNKAMQLALTEQNT